MTNGAWKLRWVAIGLTGLALAGCATGGAAKKGFEAAKRGEWDAAVAYYREALAQDPKRIEIQVELERATRTASVQHVARAKELEAQDQLSGAGAEYGWPWSSTEQLASALAKALDVERRLREQAEAARPRTRMEEIRSQAAQASPIPRLDPRTPLPAQKFQGAVRDVLNTIGSATGITVLYDRGLEGLTGAPFTVDLAGHSLESAFNMVLSQNTLTYKIVDSHTVFIYQDTPTQRQKYEDQYQQTFYLSHADAGEVNQILNQMLATTTGGTRPIITQNKTANTIVVRASAPMLGLIKNIIDTADKPRAEVLIEVTILEVDRQRMKDLGLELSQYAIGLTFSPEGAPPGPPPQAPPPISGASLPGSLNRGSFYLTVPSAVINLMESDQKTKLLAKPQLRGREGSPLTLNLGDSVPVPQTTFLPVATVGIATQPQVTYAYQSIGVNLNITAKVTYNDEIILDPIMVDKSGLGQNMDVAGQSLPTFVKRSAQVSMRLRDGVEPAGWPGRSGASWPEPPGRIGASREFGNVAGENFQTDVVMLVTPHIIRSREITADDLKPFYVGTQNNLGATAAPALISQVAQPPATTTGAVPPPGGVTPPVAGGGATTAPPPAGGVAVPVVGTTPPPAGTTPPPAGAAQPPPAGAPPRRRRRAWSPFSRHRRTGPGPPPALLVTVPPERRWADRLLRPVSVTGVSEPAR
jgi:general secretion pathway protein D